MLIRFAAAIVCMTFAACVHASMSCFVHPGGVSNAPADGDTLCWADVELPKSAVVIEKEVGGLAYMCDPIWYGCSAFSGFEAGRAGPGGWSPGFFTIDVQIRATPQDPCCFGKTYKFTYDANAKPRPPLVDLGKNSGPPSCPIRAGNPIHVGTGNNYNSERDYLGSGVFPLKFERHYNSILGIQSRRDGWRWKHTYDRAVFLDDSTAIVLRETGRALYFNQAGTDWLGDSDVPGRLERLSAGWQYVDENDFVEIYDIDGKLLSITTRAGFTQILAYDVSDRLSSVTDHFGRALLFGYDAAGDLITVTDPAGAVYSYAYNDRGNLARVTYPDETPSDPGDNPTRQYHYDDPTHPDALTGITNENGVMYVTWDYDVVGRVIANSRAGGADAVTLAYDDAAGTTTLTDALGEVRTYSFETSHNSVRVSAVSGAPCTSSCSNSFATYTYDANGYPASRTDHNGNLTTFIYDARGLETSRTEAVGTAEARTITSRWHPTYRLPELITEPGKTTVFSYDAQGRLLSQTETDTASGRSRTVINTYNTQGLLATSGPTSPISRPTTTTRKAISPRSSMRSAT
jgi:YD repeat-containing protein